MNRPTRSRSRRGAVALLGFAAVALIAAGCVPQGTHEVSSFGAGGISPGVWRTLGGSDCTWTRWTHSGAVISRVRSFGGPRYADVESTDGSFTNTGCVTFWGEPGPFSKALHNPHDALAPFGQGDYMTDFEVDPGWYAGQGAATSGDSCTWERLSGWHHTADEVIASGGGTGVGPQLVEIQHADQGFTSDGCGLWHKVFVPATATGTLVDAWTVVSVRPSSSSSFASPVPGHPITATFGGGGTLSGSTGCNDYDARYSAAAQKLALGRVSADNEACASSAVASREHDYLTALGSVVAFTFTGGGTELRLLDGNGDTLVILAQA